MRWYNFKIWRTLVLFVGPLIPLFCGFLVMSVLGFKAGVDLMLVCFVTCVQCIPQVHLWCDTC